MDIQKFSRIPEQGMFSVELGDQFISNNSGRFRFFDLPSGRIPFDLRKRVFIIQNHFKCKKQQQIGSGFLPEGLFLLDSYPVQNQSYGFNDWNDVWNNPYGNSGME
jgi:hypothetical protein